MYFYHRIYPLWSLQKMMKKVGRIGTAEPTPRPPSSPLSDDQDPRAVAVVASKYSFSSQNWADHMGIHVMSIYHITH